MPPKLLTNIARTALFHINVIPFLAAGQKFSPVKAI